MEAGAGIEPAHAGFAVPSITTLLPGRYRCRPKRRGGADIEVQPRPVNRGREALAKQYGSVHCHRGCDSL